MMSKREEKEEDKTPRYLFCYCPPAFVVAPVVVPATAAIVAIVSSVERVVVFLPLL